MVFYNTAESFCHQHPLDSTAVLADIDFVFAWVSSFFFPQPIRPEATSWKEESPIPDKQQRRYRKRLVGSSRYAMYYIELENLEQGAIAGRKDSQRTQVRIQATKYQILYKLAY